MEVRRQRRLVIRIDRLAQIVRRIRQIAVGVDARDVLGIGSSVLPEYQTRTHRSVVLQIK